MTLDAVKRCLLDQRELLLEHGVSALYAFGSVAHTGERRRTATSICSSNFRGPLVSLRLQRLAAALGHPVDLARPTLTQLTDAPASDTASSDK